MADKKSIRRDVLARRNSIPSDKRQEKDTIIMESLFSLPAFKEAKIISYFASFGSEVSTLPHIEKAMKMGKTIVLPRVDNINKRLRLFEVHNLEELKPGTMNIPEPDVPPERERDINNVDLVIMPGVAFDLEGNRLGYGAGYYDRLLAGLNKNIPRIAIAYEEQIVDSLPVESHDMKVHIIVTDKRVIKSGEVPDKEVH